MQVTAAIVTCGSLCTSLNDVTAGIVNSSLTSMSTANTGHCAHCDVRGLVPE